jgi:hypothetical protein
LNHETILLIPIIARSRRRAYTVGMTETTEKASDKLILCFVLRHLGAEREILVLKVKGQNFYAFPPYAKKPLGNLDFHMSWHESGERHAVVRFSNGHAWKEDAMMRKKSAVKLQPPAALKGVAPLFHSGVIPFQFLDLPQIGTNPGYSIVLDTEAANFRDDFIVIRAYLVEPGAEGNIPIFPDTGPRILHLVKQTTPWLAVDVYQQTAA